MIKKLLIASIILISIGLAQDSTSTLNYNQLSSQIRKDNVLKRRKHILNRNKITITELKYYYIQSLKDTVITDSCLKVFEDSLKQHSIEVLKSAKK